MILVTKTKVYAKVWNAELAQNGKYIDLKISTSEKKGEDEEIEYINSNWFARAIGHAANSLKEVYEGAKIEITSFKITNVYNKEKEKAYFNLIILEAKIVGDGNESPATATATKKDEKVVEPVKSDEDPF